MTEITRVPLQPIARGSLSKLWLGLIVAILVGAGIAWAAIPAGVKVETVQAGEGPYPTEQDVVLVNYTGKLKNGKVFDEGKNTPLPLNGMIPGFRDGLLKMQKGGKYRLEIPSDLAYGSEEKLNPQTGEVAIPANSDLVFDIDLIDFMSEGAFQQQMQMMQQMMQQQQQGAKDGKPGS